MNAGMEVADVERLYEQAEADHALVEIELDTQQLRAITAAEAAAIIDASSRWPQPGAIPLEGYDPELTDSLEALLRLSWPIWKAS